MRFDTPIYFQSTVAGAYNKRTGNYDPDTTTEDKRFASVINSKVETMNLVYGGIKQGSLTIRLLKPYTHPFDHIRVGEKEKAKIYCVDRSQVVLTKQVFVVSEVQNGKNQH